MEHIKHAEKTAEPRVFEDLNLSHNVLRAVKELGFSELTPIQQKCIPFIQQGKDVVGQSSTGSGKTAAFGLPILEKVQTGVRTQVLVLTPTRELCVQVAAMLRSFAKHLHVRVADVFGGVSINPQIEAVRKAEIVVGTPGRILDHMERRTISFENTKFLVLDEADRMFDMGFIEDVERIISHVPKKRQTLLFSATINHDVHKIVQKHLQLPVNVKVQIHVDKSKLQQAYYNVNHFEKFSLLVHLLKNKTSGLALVFCATRRAVDQVTKNLQAHGIKAMAIHGGLTQQRRLVALDALKHEHIQILVATDVAARGLDIKNVSHVYNYDVPKSAEEYVHRIGRTARAGELGDAVTLVAEKDYENFGRVLHDSNIEIKRETPVIFEQVPFSRGYEPRGGRGGYQGRGRRENFHRGRSNFRRGRSPVRRGA
ncbi:TPA: DEAD/DEAH box helicase [archaeon]|nr:DEAD/DEAH box helicase [Candidatus Naiadarchaeales archaeon SRR2090153.bin461]